MNPSNTCGDPGSSSTRGWRIDVSADGTSFTQLGDGVFYAANRGRMNTVFTGSAPGVQYIRFWILNPQVPNNPASGSCAGPSSCGTDPDDDSGVALHCGTGKDNGVRRLYVHGHGGAGRVRPAFAVEQVTVPRGDEPRGTVKRI